ncbi:class I SAM-dependent methyltransferase [Streptomyces sp. NPDC046887]|uniref:class I SAM-dependent methyltransferase n=1 Tax=Streptomyces sp. NPDC046887 TaxID=3155472 RepID=UPI0033DE1150
MNDGPDSFDDLAEAYAGSADELPFRRDIEIPSLLTALGDLTGRRVLDLGCGPGLHSRLLARAGAQVTGTDASPGMIAWARRQEAERPLGITYEVADAGATEPPGRDFDTVLAVYVLPYADTPDALTAMCRTARTALSRRGGTLVAATLNPDYATTPGYYRPYGFDLTAHRPHDPARTPVPDPHDGDTIALRTWMAGRHFDVTARYWSAATHEHALRTAGFTGITWQRPTAGPDADRTALAGYLATPHALLLTARAAPAPD